MKPIRGPGNLRVEKVDEVYNNCFFLSVKFLK